ncbi:MAG: hypothetical protein Q7U66_15845 [Methylobacter sp.]|nr:hypothetical protein [Methylobacter sp.]
MKHFTSSKFRQYLDALPANIQKQARDSYELLKQNQHHSLLQFKSVKNGVFRSVRVSLGYRIDQGGQRFWIGSHADCDKLLA